MDEKGKTDALFEIDDKRPIQVLSKIGLLHRLPARKLTARRTRPDIHKASCKPPVSRRRYGAIPEKLCNITQHAAPFSFPALHF